MDAPAPGLPKYDDIGPAINTARSANWLLAAVAVVVISRQLGLEAMLVASALLLIVGFVTLRRRGKTQPPVLLIVVVDATAIGTVLFLTGSWPTLLQAAAPYIIVSAFLLTPPKVAVPVLVYLASLTTAAHFFSPAPLSEAVDDGLVNVVVAILFLTMTAIIVAASSSSLHKIRHVERQLLASERQTNLVKDQFVSMVSHELRTPLTSIAGFADTLESGWEELQSEEISEFLGIINDQASHLRDLVEDILIIPRLEAGKLTINNEAFDPAPLAHRIISLVFPDEVSRDARVVLPAGHTVMADPRRVEQVLRNLLGNARKYGGEEVLVDGEERDGFFIISITDNGPGVPPQDQERIFDHFEQVGKGDNRTEDGVGLGLPIARELIRSMGGELWYEDAFPRGAKFSLRLPVPHAPPAQIVEPTRKIA